jgi:hypothetical protein
MESAWGILNHRGIRKKRLGDVLLTWSPGDAVGRPLAELGIVRNVRIRS